MKNNLFIILNNSLLLKNEFNINIIFKMNPKKMKFREEANSEINNYNSYFKGSLFYKE